MAEATVDTQAFRKTIRKREKAQPSTHLTLESGMLQIAKAQERFWQQQRLQQRKNPLPVPTTQQAKDEEISRVLSALKNLSTRFNKDR
ncbi:MAG TPA: hypothetical protein VG935_00655 [Patescibacteria group bacterium]|nr:hypothetical protein [Patescibacteria group bacterium]